MLSEAEAKLLKSLGEGWRNIKDIGDASELMSLVAWLEKRGVLDTRDEVVTSHEITIEGREYLERGLPERRVLERLKSEGGLKIADIDPCITRIALIWLKKLGAEIFGGEIFVGDPDRVGAAISPLEHALATPSKASPGELEILVSRGLFKERDRIERFVRANEKTHEVLERQGDRTVATRITREVIEKFENYDFKEYDTLMPVKPCFMGRKHPLQEIVDEIRDVFISMGFIETRGNFVEPSFWDMDALFVPQQHPARDLQDTFYLKNPSNIGVEDRGFVEKVKRVHEDGYNTGSKGWGYEWSVEDSERALLRTHTTVCSLRYMYEKGGNESFKSFTIGRIFRRENPDPTHLPEFMQIDGILSEKGSNLAMLIGVLKHFYAEMGFDRIRVKPSYFPYTEPSLEVEVFYRGRYLELGGSGIFRAEVTQPLGIENPVLAWGLGVERLAMLKYDLRSIKELYVSDLEWIKTAKI